MEKPAFEILRKYTLIQPQALKAMWNGPGRYYHNWDHARLLLGLAAEMKSYIEQDCNFDHLVIAILFHDAIYVPGSQLNELMSAELFKGCVRPEVGWTLAGPIYNAIMDTAYGFGGGIPAHRTGPAASPLSYWLQQLDLYQLIHGVELDLRQDQLINFVKVWAEFEDVLNPSKDWAKVPEAKLAFETGQNAFLTTLADKFKFPYEPITWKEVGWDEAENGPRKDPLDLQDIL